MNTEDKVQIIEMVVHMEVVPVEHRLLHRLLLQLLPLLQPLLLQFLERLLKKHKHV
jgi:hypothetical protein